MTKSKTSLLLTQTLINSWLYLYQVDGEYYEKAYQDFLKTLKRIPLEDNEIFARGREFEKLVPEVIDKIVVGRAVASALAGSDDDEDDDDYEEDDD